MVTLMGNTMLVGTSHIAKESLTLVKKQVKSFNPDIICLELDKQRLEGLLNPQPLRLSSVRVLGIRAFLLAKIAGYAQKKLAGFTGVQPGAEMLLGFDLAKKEERSLFLIDQQVQITLHKLIKNTSFFEKIKMPIFAIKQIISSIFKRKQVIMFDLNSVPKQETIDQLMQPLKKNFPSIYNTLITERNKIMVRKIKQLEKQFPNDKILVIIGAGHESGMAALLANTKEQSN